MKTIVQIGKSYAAKSFVSSNGIDKEGYVEYRTALNDFIRCNVENVSIVDVPGFGLHVAAVEELSDGLQDESDDYVETLRRGYVESVVQTVLSF